MKIIISESIVQGRSEYKAKVCDGLEEWSVWHLNHKPVLWHVGISSVFGSETAALSSAREAIQARQDNLDAKKVVSVKVYDA